MLGDGCDAAAITALLVRSPVVPLGGLVVIGAVACFLRQVAGATGPDPPPNRWARCVLTPPGPPVGHRGRKVSAVGRLVVIEGLDGAGKRTLAGRLTGALEEGGARVSTMAFPRYGESVHADLVREALHGEHGDLAGSVYGMGLMYALDRRGAAEDIRARRAEFDVLLLDRYVASNAAYQAARSHEDVDGPVVEWVRRTEIERFGLPVPDLHLLLRVPPTVAASRAQHRARSEADRKRDAFESDDGLQQRCAKVYDQLAARNWLSPWQVVDGVEGVDIAALAARLG